MRQLQELRLGTSEQYSMSNKFTLEAVVAAMTALKEMPELIVLEMKLPYERTLDISE